MMTAAANRGERKLPACSCTAKAGFDGLACYLGDRNTPAPGLALKSRGQVVR
jgi:hypothetical protein